MGMNKVLLHGFCGKDAEIKTTQGGKTYAKFSLATTETWKDPQGEKKSKTEWHQIIAWGKQGDNVVRFAKKGVELLITGKIEYQDAPDKDNPDKKVRFTTIKMIDFEFCGKKGENSGGYTPDPEPSGRESNYDSDHGVDDQPSGDVPTTDEDIPF